MFTIKLDRNELFIPLGNRIFVVFLKENWYISLPKIANYVSIVVTVKVWHVCKEFQSLGQFVKLTSS